MLLPERNELETLIADIIKQNVPAEVNEWLKEKAKLIKEEKAGSQLNLAFVSVPRKTGRKPVELSEEEQNSIQKLDPGFSIEGWSIDRLARLWLLMQVDASEKTPYCQKIENLFKAAEMNELVALYSSLSVFGYPEYWQMQTAEGIRSNIGTVLEAIMYHNPYPAKYLNEKAWNQLVLKALFTDKDVNLIVGLDERANKELAITLIDYANERSAAHRSVNPKSWRLVSQFIDDSSVGQIQKLFKSRDEAEIKAASLACYNSAYEPARQMLEEYPVYKTAIQKNELNWNNL